MSSKDSNLTIESFSSVERALLVFLRGYSGSEGGLRCQKYIPDDAATEAAFRSELAKLLRDKHKPVSPEMRELLADLFDPDPEWRTERILVFKFRGAGNRTDILRQSSIYSEILKIIAEHDERPTRAIELVAERFNLDVTTVMRVWSRYSWLRPKDGV